MLQMVNPQTVEKLTHTATRFAEHQSHLHPPQGEMQLFLYGAEELSYVLEVWKQLEARLPEPPLAASYDWVQTWLEHYGDLIQPWFVIGLAGDEVRGICLLTESRHQKTGPFSIASLHLGTAGEPHGHSVCVEYNDLLVEAEYRQEFLPQLSLLILAQPHWDQFQLDGIPVTTAQDWPVHSRAQRESHRLQQRIRERECRYFDLKQARESGQPILEALGKSTKSNLKRRLKQVGEITVDWAETVAEAEEIFAELVALHQARWNAAGEPGAFASPRFLGFQQKLIARLVPQKRVVLARIRTAQQTVGCLYLLVDRGRLLDYVSGFISFEEFPSPGLISHYLCMETALQRGFEAYDFLVGEKRHKENLGKSSQALQWIVCERPRYKYQLQNWGRFAKQLVRKIVKPS